MSEVFDKGYRPAPAGDAQSSSSPDFGTIVRAAWYYYEDGLTQAEVARKLFVSRQTVGRLLEAARSHGVVRIEFDTQYLSAFRTTTQLVAKLKLDDVIIVPGASSQDSVAGRLALAAAAYARRFLHPGILVGVGWGDTIARTLSLIPKEALTGVTFASAAGGVDSITEALKSNSTLVSHLKLLPAPVLVSTPELARQLNEEKSVRDVLDLAARAAITLTSVGSADPETGSSVRNGLVTPEQARRYVELGGVGDMVGEWYNARGEVLHDATSTRRIGLSLQAIRGLPRVICVAGGEAKFDAIRGAIAGGLINVLITDETTATRLLSDEG